MVPDGQKRFKRKPQDIHIDILLPLGLVVRDFPISEADKPPVVKQRLFTDEQFQNHPALHGRDPNRYEFRTLVSSEGQPVQQIIPDNESVYFFVSSQFRFLQLVQHVSHEKELLDQQICSLISRKLEDIIHVRSRQVRCFRFEMERFMQQQVHTLVKEHYTVDDQIQFWYPVDIVTGSFGFPEFSFEVRLIKPEGDKVISTIPADLPRALLIQFFNEMPLAAHEVIHSLLTDIRVEGQAVTTYRVLLEILPKADANPDAFSRPFVPMYLRERLQLSYRVFTEVVAFDCKVAFSTSASETLGFTQTSAIYQITLHETPRDILSRFFRGKRQRSAECLLRIRGRQEFLSKIDLPLAAYLSVHRELCNNDAACLDLLVEVKNKIYLPKIGKKKKLSHPSFTSPRGAKAPESTWESKFCRENKYQIQDVVVKGFSFSETIPDGSLVVEIALAHNGEILCAPSATPNGEPIPQICSVDLKPNPTQPGTYTAVAAWTHSFQLHYCELPRTAIICFVVLCVRRSARIRTPLYWFNESVFNFEGRLRFGDLEHRNTWNFPSADSRNSTNFQLLGTVLPNFNTGTPVIEFRLGEGTVVGGRQQSANFLFPTVEWICFTPHRMPTGDFQSEFQTIEGLRRASPLTVLTQPQRERVWAHFHRKLIRTPYREEDPYSFPLFVIVQSVNWTRRTHVRFLYKCLVDIQKRCRETHLWEISVDCALQLLDFSFSDPFVREFAIERLESLTDYQLELYLLQLVQALRYELYLDSGLARFLMRRAARNRRVGHFLFWHLRSEIHNFTDTVRFGLILEAYFRSCQGHIPALERQCKALNKFGNLAVLSKNPIDGRPEEHALEIFRVSEEYRSLLSSNSGFRGQSPLESPLDPFVTLHRIIPERLRFMRSATKPLMLAWELSDDAQNRGAEEQSLLSHFRILYKSRDDLRQDMLVIQMLKIFDHIWKEDGLDMRVSPYACLATGSCCGLIEIVQDSHSIASIHKGTSIHIRGVKSPSTLYDFISRHNTNQASLERAINEFTYSCAGYCVATYILGIGDRHSDNIMMKTNGQLFHIDFGHFLGNYKIKMRVFKERVPFVLVPQFMFIISKHPRKKRQFKDLCTLAFLSLWKRSALLIRLFGLMLNSGLPELNTVDELKILEENLFWGSTEAEACKGFKEKYDIAIKESSRAVLNFFLHNIAN